MLREDIARDADAAAIARSGARSARACPQGVARSYADLLLERRRGRDRRVPVGALAAGINPTDAEIAALCRATAPFTVPERRVIKYAVIGAEQVGERRRRTEAEIAAVYRNTPRYRPRETRTLQSVVLHGASAGDAQAFAQRVRGGTAFLDAARAGGLRGRATSPSPTRAASQFAGVTSAEVAAQAFRAAQGSVTGPIRSPARLPRRPGRAGHPQCRRGRSKRSAPTSCASSSGASAPPRSPRSSPASRTRSAPARSFEEVARAPG